MTSWIFVYIEARLHHINKNIEKKKRDVLKYKGHNCDNTVRYCCDLQKKKKKKENHNRKILCQNARYIVTIKLQLWNIRGLGMRLNLNYTFPSDGHNSCKVNYNRNMGDKDGHV